MKNKSIKQSLSISLRFLIGIIIGLSILALSSILSINKQIGDFYIDSYKMETNALYAKAHLIEIREFIYKTQSANDFEKQKKYVDVAEESFANMEANINNICEKSKYIKSITIEQQELLSLEIEKAQRYREKIVEITKTGDMKSVLSIFKNDYLPILNVIVKTIDEICLAANEYASQYVLKTKVHSYVTIGLFILVAMIGIVVSRKLSNKVIGKITSPLERIVQVTNQVKNGKLTLENQYENDDEYGGVFSSVEEMCYSLNKYIDHIQHVLANLENKNISSDISMDYHGDFVPIKISLIGIQDFLKDFIFSMQKYTKDLALSSDNITEVSKKMLSGVNKQNAATHQLSSILIEAADKIEDNTLKIGNSNESMQILLKLMNDSSYITKELTSNVQDISDTFESIEQANKMIQQIAENTNLLALNATIEASRGASEGNGMGVIAKQIQGLALQCKDAVTCINDMINKSRESIVQCEKHTKVVLNSIESVGKFGNDTIKTFSAIENETKEINTDIQTIVDYMNEIVHVVEDNENISTQVLECGDALRNTSDELKQMIDEFS